MSAPDAPDPDARAPADPGAPATADPGAPTTADPGAPPAPADPAPAPREKRRLPVAVVAVALTGIVIPIALVAVSYQSCLGATVRGSITAQGGTVTWRQQLGTCTADPTALAVSLDAGAAPILFAVLDPLDGPRLELRAPWQPAPIVLTPATCPGLRVDIRQRGQRDDGTQLLDGSVAASCALPHGTAPPIRLDLDAWFRACGMAEP